MLKQRIQHQFCRTRAISATQFSTETIVTVAGKFDLQFYVFCAGKGRAEVNKIVYNAAYPYLESFTARLNISSLTEQYSIAMNSHLTQNTLCDDIKEFKR